ncbi:hypothetical protein [Gordonia sp. NPDC058843]|uniref:hypothetical protein n=1 Tax=Gordonia sp. NPDC058843 TaxID=3346648 RepID=UPI0036AD0693
MLANRIAERTAAAGGCVFIGTSITPVTSPVTGKPLTSIMNFFVSPETISQFCRP